MALTRKFLRAMGIEDEKIGEIIDAHAETVDALKAERDSYRDAAEKADDLQRQLDATKKQLDEAATSDYKARYEKEASDFAAYKANVEAESSKSAKRKALGELIEGVGIKGKLAQTIANSYNLDDINIADGKIADADKITTKIKDEWKDYIPETRTEGVNIATPPQGKVTMTREQIIAMKDPAAREKAIAENIELFRKE